MVDKSKTIVTKVRRIVGLPKQVWVSAGAYSLNLPKDQDEFLIPTADIEGCSCLLALGNLEIIQDNVSVENQEREEEEEKEN